MIILASGKQVSVVIRDTDLMNGKKRFYAFYNAGFYDPENDFKPCFEGAELRRRIYGTQVDDYMAQLEKAEKRYEMTVKAYENNYEKKYAKQQPQQPAPSQVPSQEPTKDNFGSKLEQMMLQVLAEQSAGKVIETAKPLIDNYIRDTYGMLPQLHEVKTAKGTEKIEGVVHEKFDTVLNLVNADIPVFLTGAAGTGKNVICKQVAKALNLEFFFSNAVTQEHKLTGFIDANGNYHATQFYEAFTKGGLFMLDEMDASIPEVLIILNAAIANRYFDFPTGRVEAHEDFRLIAAGNTFGTGADMEYTGRFQLDAASLDRFALVEIDYSPAIEEAIANGDSELVAYIRAFRAAAAEAGIKHLATYRSIERIRKLADTMELRIVLKMCLLKNLDGDDLNTVHRIVAKKIKKTNKYVAAEEALTA